MEQAFSVCDHLLKHMKHICPSQIPRPGELGVSGQTASSVKRLATILLAAEAECAERSQAARSLSGVLEVDGTSIRKFKLEHSTTLRYLQYFGALQRGQRILNLYPLGEADSKNLGKPPPESYNKIRASGFFDDVQAGSVLVSDGAPCYPKIAKEMKLIHRSCNHSKGQFVAKSRVQGKSFKAHTGGVDSAWQLLKESIPKSVSTRAKGTAKFNSKIHMYIRAWQWRWENTAATNLCKKTAMAYLRKKDTWEKRAAKWQPKLLRNSGFKQKRQKKESNSKPSNNMFPSRSIAFTTKILLKIFPHCK